MRVRKEFELSLRLRNNLLKSRRVELGLSAREFADKAGVCYQTYLRFEGMTLTPLTSGGEWRDVAERIAMAHGLECAELWPAAVLAVQKSSVVVEIDAPTALQLGGYAQTFALPPAPDALLELAENEAGLASIRDVLNDRERAVIDTYYSDGGTLDSAGRVVGGVSRERVRQIRDRALNKLRKAARKTGLDVRS